VRRGRRPPIIPGAVFASTNPAQPLTPDRRSSSNGRPANLSADARRYIEAEAAWQALLARQRRSGRDRLDLAKAKRARLAPAQRAYVDGSHPTPAGVYTPEQLQALGAQGKAFKRKDGSWGWVILNRRDLLNALAAWRQLPQGDERLEVKAWIKARAIRLVMEDLLPAAWKFAIPPLHPNERQP
jgi:hypothetical protein